MTRRQQLFLYLSAFLIGNALIAELVGGKIFSLEGWLGVRGVGIQLGSYGPYDFNLTSGALLWPLVFVTSDLVNEYFGPAGVRRISLMAVAMILYSFAICLLVVVAPPAGFWLDVNSTDPAGRPFDVNYAYTIVLRSGLGIMIGSVTAFLIGQLVDATVFAWIRRRTGERFLALRATGSTLVSQLIDSFVVLYVAFYAFGNWSLGQVGAVAVVNYLYKTLAALALTPLLYIAHAGIDRYLGAERHQPPMDGPGGALAPAPAESLGETLPAAPMGTP